MNVIELGLHQLREAPWNPNRMGEDDLARLRNSMQKYGLVQNLVVRPVGPDLYEVLSGNQRLKIIRKAGIQNVPCLVIEVDEAHGRLLSQALNHIHGQDDLGLRAETVRRVLETISQEEVLSLLPETASGLNALSSLGNDTIADCLERWEHARNAKLKHMQFQLTPNQVDIVQEALAQVLPVAKQGRRDSPNIRSTALYLLCKEYLKLRGEK
jgi:ParB family transcriptional regulator, chromosome partitioning protein